MQSTTKLNSRLVRIVKSIGSVHAKAPMLEMPSSQSRSAVSFPTLCNFSSSESVEFLTASSPNPNCFAPSRRAIVNRVEVGNAPNMNAIDILSEGLPKEAKLYPSGTAISSRKTPL